MGAPVDFYSATQSINFYSRPEDLQTNAVLYLGMDTGFSDYTLRHIVSTIGSMVIDTVDYVLNGGSGSFNGTDAYISIPDSNDFNILTGDEVTIDFNFLLTDDSGQRCYFFHPGVGSEFQAITTLNAGTPFSVGNIFFLSRNSLGGQVQLSASTGPFVPDTWYNLRFTKASNRECTFYLGGVKLNSDTLNSLVLGQSAWPNMSGDINIGRWTIDSPNLLSGNIDEFAFLRTVRVPGGQPINFYSLP